MAFFSSSKASSLRHNIPRNAFLGPTIRNSSIPLCRICRIKVIRSLRLEQPIQRYPSTMVVGVNIPCNPLTDIPPPRLDAIPFCCIGSIEVISVRAGPQTIKRNCSKLLSGKDMRNYAFGDISTDGLGGLVFVGGGSVEVVDVVHVVGPV